MPSFFRDLQKAFAEIFQEIIQPHLEIKTEYENETDDPDTNESIEIGQKEINEFVESLLWEFRIFGDNKFEQEKDEKLQEAKL